VETGRRRSAPPFSLSFVISFVLLGASIVLGGSARPAPYGLGAIEFLGLLLLARLAFFESSASLYPAFKIPLLILAGIAAIPLVQIVPLPPGLWRSLPGHQIAAIMADRLGVAERWRPISLDPDATISSWLSLLPAIAVFLATLRAPAIERRMLLLLILAMALLSSVIATMQMLGVIQPFYADTDPAFPGGLFANRNHQADLLVAGLVVLPVLVRERAGIRRNLGTILVGALGALLASAILASGSRAGFVMLAAVLGYFGVAAIRRLRRRAFMLMVAAICAAAAASLVLLATFTGATLIERFGSFHDLRWPIFRTAWKVALRYFPFGSGLGTFKLVYNQGERLEDLSPGYINNAHDDYLELLITAGLPAIILLLIFGQHVSRPLWISLKRSQLDVTNCAAMVVALFLLHSFFDFSLHTPALMTVFATCLGILVSSRRAEGEEPSSPTSPTAGARSGRPPVIMIRSVAGVAAIACSFLVLRDAVVAHAVEGSEAIPVLSIGVHSSGALSNAAEHYYLTGDNRRAEESAKGALTQVPIDPRALRVLAFALDATGRRQKAGQLMDLAPKLGWRDVLSQIWLLHDAIYRRAWQDAALRFDVIAREGYIPDGIASLPAIMRDPNGRSALASLLARNPPWRRDLVRWLGELPEDQLGNASLLTRDIAAKSGALRADEINPLVDRLTAVGRVAEARRLWHLSKAYRPGLDQENIYDGSFAATQIQKDYISPFEWQLYEFEGVEALIDRPQFRSDGRALAIRVTAQPSGAIVAQREVLGPARYRLSWLVAAKDGQVLPAIEWRIICVPSQYSLLSVRASAASAASRWRRFDETFVVPANCPSQELQLVASLDNDYQSEETLWLDDVSISRILVDNKN
jgi:O-antigen ligase